MKTCISYEVLFIGLGSPQPTSTSPHRSDITVGRMKQPDSPTWQSTKLRLLFDFIEGADRDRKSVAYLQIGAFNFLRERLEGDQAKGLSLSSVKDEVTRIVRAARSNEKYSAGHFWRLGLSALNLQHPCLSGVYTESELVKRGYQLESAPNNVAGSEERGTSVILRVSKRQLELMPISDHDDGQESGANATSNSLPHDAGSDVEDHGHSDALPPRKRPKYTEVFQAEDTSSEAEEQQVEEPRQKARKLDGKKPKHVKKPEKTPKTGRSRHRPTQPSAARKSNKIGDATVDASVVADSDTTDDSVATASPLPPLQTIPVIQVTDHDRDSEAIAPRPDETGFLDKPPRSAAMVEVYKIYEDLEAAINDFIVERGGAATLPRLYDKRYSQDAQSLIGIVSGMTAAEAGQMLVDVQSIRPLPLSMFLRSIAAAGVMLWAMSPDPIDMVEAPVKSQMLSNLQEVLQEELSIAGYNRLMFLARQRTLKEQSSEQIRNIAVILGSRLYKVINEFVEPSQQKVTSRCEKSRSLAPPQRIVLYPADRMAGRADVPPPPARIDHSPVPGSTSLESDLSKIFEFALNLRLKWSANIDADIRCDFPIFRQRYDEVYMYNEEYVEGVNASTGLPMTAMSELNKRVFVTIIFGVRVNTRERWSDSDYCGQNVIVTRPSVYLLD